MRTRNLLIAMFTIPVLVSCSYSFNTETIIYTLLILAVCLASLYLVKYLFKLGKIQKQLKQISFDLPPEEQVVIEGNTKLCIPGGKIPGKLFLTPSRLVYCSINNEHNIEKIEMPLKEIDTVELDKVLRKISIGIKILQGEKEYRFNINYPNDWCSIIKWQKILFKAKN